MARSRSFPFSDQEKRRNSVKIQKQTNLLTQRALTVGEALDESARDIVKCCVSETGASLLKCLIKRPVGLFFTIDETNTGNYLWNQFESLQPAPMLLGFQTKFEDHRQGRDS
jgi:hypothetical protein